MALLPSYHTGFFFVFVPEASATILALSMRHSPVHQLLLGGAETKQRLGGRICCVPEEGSSEEQVQAREEQRERRGWVGFLEILCAWRIFILIL